MPQYTNDDVEVTYDPGVCIHAGNCVKSLPSVFDLDRDPWIDPSGASADEVEATVKACPSGALGFRRL